MEASHLSSHSPPEVRFVSPSVRVPSGLLGSLLALWVVLAPAGALQGQVAAAPPGEPASLSREALRTLVPELEAQVRRTLMEGNIPSLTMALVVGDSTVWEGGFGYANLWARTPAIPETVYLIGSTFKTHSTAGLLQLMEEGRFHLDDPVRRYLGVVEIRGEDPEDPVTFRHLLTHTSGLPVTFGPHRVWGNTAPRPFREYFEAELEVVSPPLDSLRYSNIAYTLAAHLIEEMTGEDYAAFIQDRIFQPLGLTSTAFEPTPGMDERLAVPYLFEEETGHRPAERLKADAWPAGITYGTIRNQARWLRLNLNGGELEGARLLSPETVEAMHTVQHDPFRGPIGPGWGGEAAGWGLTWWADTRRGDRYFAHSGSVPGYTAFLEGNRDRGVGVALLSNGHAAHLHLFRLSEWTIDRVLDALDKEAAGR